MNNNLSHFKNLLISFFISYCIWTVIGLNGWVMSLRQRELYYMYQFFFFFFLILFFWIYLIKYNPYKILPSLFIGLGFGYIASFLAICLWPLLAPDGWHKFLNMRWDLLDISLSAVLSCGWINGLIMAIILWLFCYGNNRQLIFLYSFLFVIVIIRLLISPKSILLEFLPLY